VENNDRKRFVSFMLLILAALALIWALLRVYNVMQDHREAAAQTLATG
jgi:hypothetical protein